MPTVQILLGLLLLLPGLLAAKTFDALVARKNVGSLDKLVEALIFELAILTLYATAAVIWPALVPATVGSSLSGIAEPDKIVSVAMAAVAASHLCLLTLMVLSLALGLLAAILYNYDQPWQLLRRLRFTKNSSRATVWHGSFHGYQNFVIVHLADGRRIIGWPYHYADDPDEGELFLSHATYINDDSQSSELVEIRGPGVLITKHAHISHIEFLEAGGKSDGEETDSAHN